MDIEEISGPKVPDIYRQPAKSRELSPLDEKSRLQLLQARTDPYEDIDRWMVEDRVTISSRARRKYREMLAAKRQQSEGMLDK